MSERQTPYLRNPTAALAERAGQAAEELSIEQRATRAAAWASIRAVLDAVRGKLGGAPLRGMENLATSTKPWRGVQVRSKRGWDPLPPPPRAEAEYDPTVCGRPVLVLAPDAHLVIARRSGLGDVETRAATEDDILAEDAEAVAETVVWALRRHLIDAGNAKVRYRSMRRLAERIERALKEG